MMMANTKCHFEEDLGEKGAEQECTWLGRTCQVMK